MPVSDDLDTLEQWIRQIGIEWEKFFSGIEKKPPNDFKFRLEKLVRQYAGAEIRNNTERFRYNTLTARYNTFNELWQKKLRALEEGRVVGLHGRAASSVSAAYAAMAGVPALAHAAALAAGAVPGAAPGERAAAPQPAANPNEVRVADPSRDGAAVKTLFERYMDARKKAGEPGVVKYEAFEKLIGQQASRIVSEKGAKAVDFRLEVKDGKVSLKAKPVK